MSSDQDEEEEEEAEAQERERSRDSPEMSATPPQMSESESPTPFAEGVNVVTLTAGDGVTFPVAGDTVSVHYRGVIHGSPGVNGKEFDNSRDLQMGNGKPIQFTVGAGDVIKGWDEGIVRVSLGETARFEISSEYGYDYQGGHGVDIDYGQQLMFEVELLTITKPETKEPGQPTENDKVQLLEGDDEQPAEVDTTAEQQPES